MAASFEEIDATDGVEKVIRELANSDSGSQIP
jgi:hypothetical protein